MEFFRVKSLNGKKVNFIASFDKVWEHVGQQPEGYYVQGYRIP